VPADREEYLMNAWGAASAIGVVAGYAAVSRRVSTTVVSGPMVFVSFGLAIGPLGLDWIDRSHDAELTRTLLEGALALLLFTDASSKRTHALRREHFLPVRLLGIGLLLTMGLGWLVAWLVLPGLGVWELALAGVILAPTDAALGQQAVSDRRVPALVRDGLSVESGLNDGIALPFFVLALAAAGGQAGDQGPLATFLRALVVSSAIGLAAGWLGARLLGWSSARDWSTPHWRQLLVLAVPVSAYAVAAGVEGSGFIAVWVAGLAFGAFMLRGPAPQQPETAEERVGHEVAFTDRLGALLGALSFLAFGAVILGPALQHLTWRMLVYAALSLTVVRMLPVVVALLGTGLRPPTLAYLAWFGPRGLASLVFGLIAFEDDLPGRELLSGVIAVTVAMSVYAHGASASWLGFRYGAWYAAALRRDPGLRESAAEPEHAAGAVRPTGRFE
jgi:NhaP-type Na+/H+ or K+/H+ antiporter